MSDTTAVQSDVLARANHSDDGRPLCPACHGGRLHPYKVEISLNAGGTWSGADYLVGWLAVRQGAKAGEHYIESDQEPCGFSLPMQPRTWAGDRKERAA